MAIQWVAVCSSDLAPAVDGSGVLICPTVVQVVPFKYLSEDEQSLGSLLSLSSADATAVSFAIIGVWLAAWGVKMAIRVLRGNDNVEFD